MQNSEPGILKRETSLIKNHSKNLIHKADKQHDMFLYPKIVCFISFNDYYLLD